jgi:transcriptional regulator with XRE-family HTH domain
MVERILLVLKVKNLSPSKFADEIGIQRSSMSHIMSGRNLPSLDLTVKVMNKFPDINPEWLLLGVGQMIKTKQIDLFESSSISDETKVEPIQELLHLPLEEPIILTEKEKIAEKPQEKELTNEGIGSNSFKNEENKSEISIKSLPISEPEIEKIVILYKNKSFKEYYPSL